MKMVLFPLLRDPLAQPIDWRKQLAGLSRINWSRSNGRLWEGRAMIGGRVSKTSNSVVLTASAIKTHLKLELTPDEERAEAALRRAARAA